jgi:hypothetical protein
MNRAWVLLLAALFGSLDSAAQNKDVFSPVSGRLTQSQASCGPIAIEAKMASPPSWVEPNDRSEQKVSITLKKR